MIYLLIGYVYLSIHRPFEIWTPLGDLRLELVYFSVMTVCWVASGLRVRGFSLLLAILGMAMAFLLSWAMSRWAERAEQVVKNYTLVLVFAMMIATSVRDERGLHALVVTFLAVLTVYMLHSVWEYKNGRHTYRMGIPRLVGVDATLGDPNSFGATLVYALPFTRYLWVVWPTGWKRRAVAGYVLLSVGCVLLTGSRSSLAGVVVWALMSLLLSRRKLLYLTVFAVVGVASLAVLPDDLKTRFETIIDPSVGPKNAQESGQGRIEGFFTGLRLWSEYPIAGCGPSAWRPASGAKLESHNLYGQLVGELGTTGLIAFTFMVGALFANLRKLKKLAHPLTGAAADPRLFALGQAMTLSTLLLLFEGLFGHNLYRYNWGWYCGFTAVALAVCRERLADPAWLPADDEDEEWESSTCFAAG